MTVIVGFTNVDLEIAACFDRLFRACNDILPNL